MGCAKDAVSLCQGCDGSLSLNRIRLSDNEHELTVAGAIARDAVCTSANGAVPGGDLRNCRRRAPIGVFSARLES
jgi:hypothetical protein